MSEIRECSTDGCEAFACHGETKCVSCLADEHRAKQATPRAPLTVGEAIDLLSLAARSSTWQGADPALAKVLLEVLRSETEACFRAQINRDHMRNERDEARAEIEAARNVAAAAGFGPRDSPLQDLVAVMACREYDAAQAAREARAEVERLSELHLGEFRARLAMQRERDEACAHVAAATVTCECPAKTPPRLFGLNLDLPSGVLATVESPQPTRPCARCHGDGHDECQCEHPTPPVDVPDLARPVCSTCDDTHTMSLNGRPVACTLCPSPCDRCRNHFAYCASTPCSCDCHGERPTPPERPAKHLEQPMPTGNGIEVFRVAIADCPSVSLAEALKAREAVGIERYGTTLRTHNGRDVVRDLREELADAYVYATQAGMEAEAGEPPPDHLLSSVRWALVEAWRALEEHERRRRLEVP